MAFTLNTLARIGSSQTNGIPTVWQYTSEDDTRVQMGVSGYFNDISDVLQIGDVLHITDSVNSSDMLGVKLNVNGVVLAVTIIDQGTLPPGSVGTTELADLAVTKAKLELSLQPSHIIVFADKFQTVGAQATVINVPGALVTDISFADININGGADVIVSTHIPSANLVSVLFAAAPQPATIINWQVIRAT